MYGLNRDGNLLFITRFIRLFSYGFLAVGLILYLSASGFSQRDIGILFTATLLGDLAITFYLTTTADHYGRRNVLIVGATLKLLSGLVYAYFWDNYPVLLVTGILGIISPSGGEIGPFLAIEQAALTESIKEKTRLTKIFVYYNLWGYIAQATGALASGALISVLVHNFNYSEFFAYRAVIMGYALFGGLKLLIYLALSDNIEPLHTRSLESTGFFSKFGLHRSDSVRIVLKLSALFIIDSFAGGFVMQTIIVYWFAVQWGFDSSLLGLLLMGCNVLSGLSALAAPPLVNKIGAINTMVVTHFPSNIFLLLVPFMPTKESAVAMLLLRFTISQMDVPARQYYVVSVVAEDERSAAGGITNIVRSIGLSMSPLVVGYLLSDPSNKLMFGLPFVISGSLKCLYDVLLYASFQLSKHDKDVGISKQANPTTSSNKNFSYQAVPTTSGITAGTVPAAQVNAIANGNAMDSEKDLP